MTLRMSPLAIFMTVSTTGADSSRPSSRRILSMRRRAEDMSICRNLNLVSLLCASALQRGHDSRAMVANQAKSRCLGVFLHESSQGGLSVASHRVDFVQNDQFGLEIAVVRKLLFRGHKWTFALSEAFDCVANYVDSAIITRIQFENH